jgi:hypothetical protein
MLKTVGQLLQKQLYPEEEKEAEADSNFPFRFRRISANRSNILTAYTTNKSDMS